MSTANRLRLSFLGGASAIGASCTLLEAGDRAILIDCGVRFKVGQALPDLDQLSGKRLDAVVLTHAHSDHSGALPVLHEAFPGTPIYLTPPTADLVSILQRDALKLMGLAEREGELPLYTERQVENLVSALHPVHHNSPFSVGDLELTLLPASHILGAAMLHVTTPAGNVLLTGDYSVSRQRTVPGLPRPQLPVDLLITESTYGNRLHADRKTAEQRLIQRVRAVLETGGRVLIPAFAIGRAQEVLLLLKSALRDGQLPSVPVFVDGMVRSVCQVYGSHERYLAEPLARELRHSGNPFSGEPFRFIRHPADRKEALDAGACVFVASSGMLSGGPSALYAAALAGVERDAILITGYQDEESPGRALLRLAEQAGGQRDLRLGDKIVEVRCAFETYSLSAHADRLEMTALAEVLQPRTAVLVHGDREARQGLHDALQGSCHDIESAEEGTQIARSFPARRKSKLSSNARPDRGQDLEPTPEAAARILAKLPPTGPAAEDEVLAEELKRENPKGRLLELCQRLKLPPPRLFETTQAGQNVAEFQVQSGEQKLSSGVQRAWSRKTAEQLAARALLAVLLPPEVEARPVESELAERLKRENPKGRLIELGMQRKLGAPAFEAVPVPGGFQVRVSLGGRDSGTWQAPKAKDAEQAAAADLLQNLLQTPEAEMRPQARPAEPDARGRLNELRQTGRIEDFGYQLVEQKGEPHQPIFVFRGWAQAPGGERVHTDPIDATSKKEGQLLAANQLFRHLRDSGWF